MGPACRLGIMGAALCAVLVTPSRAGARRYSNRILNVALTHLLGEIL
jgi:hypothetical protein